MRQLKNDQDFYLCKGKQKIRYTFKRKVLGGFGLSGHWLVEKNGGQFNACPGIWKHNGWQIKPIIRITESKQ